MFIENFKKPLAIIALLVAFIAVISPLLGWFSIGNELVRELADSELAKKESISIGLSVISLVMIVIAVATQKHRTTFATLPFALYGLVLVINQKPDTIVAEQLQLSVLPGYWLSIVATLGVLILSVIIGIRGFNFTKQEKIQSE